MNDAIRQLRSEARQLARGKLPKAIRYPVAFRDGGGHGHAEATRPGGLRESRGRRAGTAGAEPASAGSSRVPAPVLRPVAVRPDPGRRRPPTAGPVLSRPQGVRVEGLDRDTLSPCSAPRVIGSTRQVAVWAYGAAADLRKGFDGLSALVSQGLGRDPLSGDCYLFVNATRKRAKVLLWDGTGLCIYAKRLERGRFASLWRDADARARAADDERAAALSRGQHAGRARRALAGAVCRRRTREKILPSRAREMMSVRDVLRLDDDPRC